MSDLESANERFMEAIQAAELKRASLLTIMLYELKCVDENRLIREQVEGFRIGAIDLGHCQLLSPGGAGFDPEACWATSTLPFDRIEDHFLIATCYYLSAPAVKYWREQLGERLIWYVASDASMREALERLDEIAENEAKAAEEASEDA